MFEYSRGRIMKKELRKFCKIVAAAAICAVGVSNISEAATYLFNTSDSQFDAGVNNQGYWSDIASNIDSNSNVLTGRSTAEPTARSFFTFDLSGFSLAAGEVIVGATFSGNTFTTQGDGLRVETLGFFDVSTDAATLNNNQGLNASIFNDLGTGTQYGAYDFTGQTDNLDFAVALNNDFIADATAAQGGFLSIGGSLLTIDPGFSQYIFLRSSRNPNYSLTLETRLSAVPLPAGLPLYGAGIAILGFWGWRRKKAQG